ncbi:MAG TPA: AAA family ATPase [Candidatus Limnocylindrales bacterium]|jgi:pilus assembly protein CpaE
MLDTTAPGQRPTILVAMAAAEQSAVVAELVDAGFAVIEAHSPADLTALSTSTEPFALAVTDTTMTPDATLEAIGELRRHRPGFATLFVTSVETFDVVDRAGIGPTDELALRPVTADSLRWRVEAMVIRSSADEASGQVDSTLAGETLYQLNAGSPILAVFNPKGGVGKTTIATNLAAMLQVRKGRRVLLVDGDTVTGHVALSLGIKSVRGVADTWGGELDTDAADPIMSLTTEHSSGVKVATLTADPLALPHLNADRVADLLLEARAAVDTIIVDLHPSYSDVNLAIFATATRILVPVTPDLPAIRAAVQLTRVAQELGVRDRLSLVVNRANSGVSVRDIEETTGMTAVAELRSAGMLLVRAGNLGKTLVEQFPREKVTGDFDKLADKVLQLVGAGSPTRAIAPSRAPRLAALVGAKAAASM